MSNASKKTETSQIKEINAWHDKAAKTKALELAVGLVNTGTYDPKNIVEDAQIFYGFLNGK